MALERELVLVRAADLVLHRDALGVRAHVARLGAAPQAVVDGRVDQLGIAQAIAEARLGDQVRPLVHVLHAARDDELRVARADLGRGEHHGLQAGATNAVDRRGAGRVGEATLEGRLARRRLAHTGLQDLAHEHFVDLVRRDAGALHCGADGDAAERRCRHVCERAVELADRRPRRRHEKTCPFGPLNPSTLAASVSHTTIVRPSWQPRRGAASRFGAAYGRS